MSVAGPIDLLQGDDIPEEMRAELADLDRLDDEALGRVARERWSAADTIRYDGLLALHEAGCLTGEQRAELTDLRDAHDRFMLRKAHATALLEWRRHQTPRP